jgi:carboxypeptidase PM20D1
MKRVLLILFLGLLILIAVLAGRALMLPSMQMTAPPAAALTIDRAAALARFSRAIQFRTVSYSENPQPVEHDAFVQWLPGAYPRVHAAMKREVIAGRSLLYTWPGSDASLAPVLLMGHYDVVPVERETERQWEQPPFSGANVNGFIYGRGTLDDKCAVIGLLESAELLLAEGYRPKRTILFAFGHDEELGGAGAAATAKLLASRGVKLDAVIDEGGVILTNGAIGVKKPVAVIGIAEKGIVSVELLASSPGGHSSMPPPRTNVGLVAAAVDRLQNKPFPSRISGATAEMLRWVAPEAPFGTRLVLANTWLFKPVLDAQARELASLNASLRTTIAPTMISGGVKENVMPSQARAVVNFRILPGDTVRGVLEHVREAIGDGHVRLRMSELAQEPSPVSDPRAPQFRTLQRTLAQVFPKTVATPYLVTGATDARHYSALTANIYRFKPVAMTEEDLRRYHGLNERIGANDFIESIRFYRTLLVNFSA